jgi:hypothetical protein
MKAAGDVGRTDQGDNFFVQTYRVVPEAFAHIGIEIDNLAGLLHVVSFKALGMGWRKIPGQTIGLRRAFLNHPAGVLSM